MTVSARALWQATEPVHAVVYFAPEVPDALSAIGIRGWWRGYFAGRAAPMGAVTPAVVAASFANFAPAMVARALPSAWAMASPSEVTAARGRGLGATFERLAPTIAAHVAPDRGPSLETAAGVLDRAADTVGGEGGLVVGRPLAAAWAAARQEWARASDSRSDSVVERLWWSTTVLREHRGDGHVMALSEAGLDGCEAHLTLAGTGRVPGEMLREARGWTEEQWEDAAERLQRRRLLGPDGALTGSGRELRASVEARTDRLAWGPWSGLGDEDLALVERVLAPLGRSIARDLPIRVPNPMGWEPAP